MLITLLLALAPPVGSAPDTAVVVPHLSRLETLIPFLDRAADRNNLFRRDSWRGVLHPLIEVDFTSKASMTEAGIDPNGAGSLWTDGPITVVCLELADPKKFDAKAKDKLGTLGSPWKGTVGGVSGVGSKNGAEKINAASLTKGRLNCSARATQDGLDATLPALAKLMTQGGGLTGFSSVPGDVVTYSKGTFAGIKANGLTAEAELKSSRWPLGKLHTGTSPYASLETPGMAVMRLEMDPAPLAHLDPAALGELAAATGLTGTQLSQSFAALAPLMTGDVAMLISQVKVRGSLRTAQGRFFSLQQAWLVALKDEAAAAKARALLESVPGASADRDGYALKNGLRAGVSGRNLWFTDDDPTLKTLLDALPAKPSAQKHGLELTLDAPKLTQALRQVPLLDAVSDPNLGILLALSTELGPLLSVTSKLNAVFDADKGGYTGHLTWTLAPPAPNEKNAQ